MFQDTLFCFCSTIVVCGDIVMLFFFVFLCLPVYNYVMMYCGKLHSVLLGLPLFGMLL